jgi:hypothetical protein
LPVDEALLTNCFFILQPTSENVSGLELANNGTIGGFMEFNIAPKIQTIAYDDTFYGQGSLFGVLNETKAFFDGIACNDG